VLITDPFVAHWCSCRILHTKCFRDVIVVAAVAHMLQHIGVRHSIQQYRQKTNTTALQHQWLPHLRVCMLACTCVFNGGVGQTDASSSLHVSSGWPCWPNAMCSPALPLPRNHHQNSTHTPLNTHPLIHSLTHSPNHPHTHSPNHPLTHSSIYSLTRPFTH